MDASAFPTRTGARRDRNNILKRVVQPVLARANRIRSERGDRRSSSTSLRTPSGGHRSPFTIAAGFDLPYIQAQVGHLHPTTTLAIYAQLMARPDRDQLRAEIRELLGAPERSLAAHRLILDAIIVHESELAQQVMFRHLEVNGEMMSAGGDGRGL